jgi:hypothetical protein
MFTFSNPGAAPDSDRSVAGLNSTQTPPGSLPVPAGVTLTAAENRTIIISGPATLDRDAAQRIFNQQLSSGALIGLRPGDVISAATQAANGLTSAESQLLQQISQTSNQVEQITPVKTIAEVLLKVPLTNEITVADYAKQPAAIDSIGGLSAVQVTSVLAQLRKLVNQPSTVLTSTGLGVFGLSAQQLAAAKYLKASVVPLIQSGQSSLISVLKSPNSWTGLNGISTVQNLLLSENIQQQIQQFLMISALSYLKDIGIAIDQLPPRSQAGALLSVAKDPATAVSWLKGQPVPTEFATLFSQYVRDGAYSVDFANSKINSALANESLVLEVTDATDRARLDAATNRIVGNPKIPPLIYGTEPVNPVLVEQYTLLQTLLTTTQTQVDALDLQTITVQTAGLRQIKLEKYKSTTTALKTQVAVLRKQTSTSIPVSVTLVTQLDQLLKQIENLADKINNSIKFVEQAKSQLQSR